MSGRCDSQIDKFGLSYVASNEEGRITRRAEADVFVAFSALSNPPAMSSTRSTTLYVDSLDGHPD